MHAMLDAAAGNADTVLALGRRLRSDVAHAAGAGTLIVSGTATSTRHTLDLIDPETGADRAVDVDWRSALDIQPRLTRPRPYGYLLPASETVAAKHLVGLGATVMRIEAALDADGERYRITRMQETRKDDVRRNDEDTPTANIVQIATVTEPTHVTARAGDYYVPMDQPLANVIAAALEPDTQSSYAANHLLTLPRADGAMAAYLPLYRLPARVTIATVVWDGR